MATKRLKDFLDKNGTRYVSIVHSPAYTAQEIADCSLISGKEMAKTVIIKVDSKIVMAVLPASYMIDFRRLKEYFETDNVRLAEESEFIASFPGCDVGAMPPFGNLFNLELYMDPHMTSSKKITFNAGTQQELLSMTYRDYEQLANPVKVSFSYCPASFAA